MGCFSQPDQGQQRGVKVRKGEKLPLPPPYSAGTDTTHREDLERIISPSDGRRLLWYSPPKVYDSLSLSPISRAPPPPISVRGIKWT